MDPRNFTAPHVGVVRQTLEGYRAFHPELIPRRPKLSARTILRLSEADAALGRLAGAGRLLPDPNILVNPYVVREAVASSRIEGTQASISDVFYAEASGRANPDVQEVLNYIRALERGLQLLPELPLSNRLVCTIHEELLTGVRGKERTPGEFRRTQNWIGSSDATLETAVFVPPPPDEVNPLLADWERFAHETPPIPVLIQCALLHYQFETIHPFLDGNGRLGRLLIVFFLVEQGRLPAPLLYISSFFEDNRSEYYDRLQGDRERGEYQLWFQFFLTAIEVQAKDAVRRAERLADLREEYRAKMARISRSRVGEVVEILFEIPIVTARLVADRLKMSVPGAKNLLELLQEQGILEEAPPIRPQRARRWIANDILQAIID
jgi:Fic family protein